MYGAALYRLRKEDFGELQHHDGISPAWPIAYDELEPYYSLAEQLYHVHGARGEDPTEPPASAPYPHPAVSHEPRIQQLADDLAAAGGVIAFYQLGYGIAAFGVGPLEDAGVELSTVYGLAAIVAGAMGAWSFVVAGRRRSPASVHPLPGHAAR